MSLSSCPRYDSGSQCSTGILHSCSNPWLLCCQSHGFPLKVPPSQPYQTGAPPPQPLFKKPQSLHIRTGLSQDLHILLAVKSSSMSYSVWIRITPQGRGPENKSWWWPPTSYRTVRHGNERTLSPSFKHFRVAVGNSKVCLSESLSINVKRIFYSLDYRG